MSHKDEIFDAAEKILQLNKPEWTPAEFAILIQSQYYNIEELFTVGANYTDDDIEIKIEISEKIINICCAFNKNLELFPEKLIWNNREGQIERVNSIYEEVYKSLQLQRAIKTFKDDPSPFNAMKMKILSAQ